MFRTDWHFQQVAEQSNGYKRSVLTNFLSGYEGTDMIVQNGMAGWSELKDKLQSKKWTFSHFHYHLTKLRELKCTSQVPQWSKEPHVYQQAISTQIFLYKICLINISDSVTDLATNYTSSEYWNYDMKDH